MGLIAVFCAVQKKVLNYGLFRFGVFWLRYSFIWYLSFDVAHSYRIPSISRISG